MSDTAQNIIKAYHTTMHEFVRARVHLIHALLRHQGEKGTANERVLGEILEDFLPAKYGVHSGFLVDHRGRLSSQTDIVITDELNHPNLFSTLSSIIHPIDSVVATIEVKTTLNLKELKKSTNNLRKLRSDLQLLEKPRGLITPPGVPPIIVGHPISVLFAFTMNYRPWDSVTGLLRSFQAHMKSIPNEEKLDLIYILDRAIVIGWRDNPEPHPALFRPCAYLYDPVSKKRRERDLPFYLACARPAKTGELKSLGADESGVGLVMFLQLLHGFMVPFQTTESPRIVSAYAQAGEYDITVHGTPANSHGKA